MDIKVEHSSQEPLQHLNSRRLRKLGSPNAELMCRVHEELARQQQEHVRPYSDNQLRNIRRAEVCATWETDRARLAAAGPRRLGDWLHCPIDYEDELQAVVASVTACVGAALYQLQAELSNQPAPRTRGVRIRGRGQKRH